MEKMKFISIFSSNLDEFYMVRVGSLSIAQEADITQFESTGMNIQQQLDAIAVKNRPLVEEQYKCLNTIVLPELEKAGIFFHRVCDLTAPESERLRNYFLDQVFPILTPLAVDAGHPFPYLGNLKENLMVLFSGDQDENARKALAFVEVPIDFGQVDTGVVGQPRVPFRVSGRHHRQQSRCPVSGNGHRAYRPDSRHPESGLQPARKRSSGSADIAGSGTQGPLEPDCGATGDP